MKYWNSSKIWDNDSCAPALPRRGCLVLDIGDLPSLPPRVGGATVKSSRMDLFLGVLCFAQKRGGGKGVLLTCCPSSKATSPTPEKSPDASSGVSAAEVTFSASNSRIAQPAALPPTNGTSEPESEEAITQPSPPRTASSTWRSRPYSSSPRTSYPTKAEPNINICLITNRTIRDGKAPKHFNRQILINYHLF